MRSFLVPSVLLAALTLCGCDHAYIVARVGPIPPRPYVVGPVGVAPGPAYIWIDGYWDLHGGAWIWAPGDGPFLRGGAFDGKLLVGSGMAVVGDSTVADGAKSRFREP